MPDWVAVSVGDGCTIAGIWKGLVEMHALGFIPRLPRLLGVQAEGARALVDAFARGDATGHRSARRRSRTASRRPSAQRAQGARRGRARRRARSSPCSDDAIVEAIGAVGRLAGVFGEPAGVAGVAGLRRAVADGIVGKQARVVAVVTGNGLKDAKTALRAVGKPFDLAPDDAALDALLAEHPPA